MWARKRFIGERKAWPVLPNPIAAHPPVPQSRAREPEVSNIVTNLVLDGPSTNRLLQGAMVSPSWAPGIDQTSGYETREGSQSSARVSITHDSITINGVEIAMDTRNLQVEDEPDGKVRIRTVTHLY